MTEEIANLTVEICTLVKQFKVTSNLSKNPLLRKNNRIKTIYSSLAIEHNSLSEDQVTAVIEGKHVIAPHKDITEVQNAYQAYDMLENIDPFSVKDLLSIHGLMMKDLVADAGHFRSKGVGIYKGSELIHMGTRPEFVEYYIKKLLDWTKRSKLHPLIKAGAFHYEFEYIHPFSDGNGRTGRFWHTLILSKWEPLFAWIPVENLIHKRQAEYYKAISDSNKEGKSTIFILFMLGVVKEVLEENVGINVGIKNLVINQIKDKPHVSANEIALNLGYSQRQVERTIAALKRDGHLIRMGSNKNGYWEIKED